MDKWTEKWRHHRQCRRKRRLALQRPLFPQLLAGVQRLFNSRPVIWLLSCQGRRLQLPRRRLRNPRDCLRLRRRSKHRKFSNNRPLRLHNMDMRLSSLHSSLNTGNTRRNLASRRSDTPRRPRKTTCRLPHNSLNLTKRTLEPNNLPNNNTKTTGNTTRADRGLLQLNRALHDSSE